jgi:hypothetical protein
MAADLTLLALDDGGGAPTRPPPGGWPPTAARTPGPPTWPAVLAALTVLRAEAGELPPDEMDGFSFPGEERCNCTCPPELLKRGGFGGGCPVHAW